jgi:hypothetical protein
MKGFKPGTRVSAIGRREFVKLGATASAMMTLNAGGSLAKSTTGRRMSIDVHTHWAPEAYSKCWIRCDRPRVTVPIRWISI